MSILMDLVLLFINVLLGACVLALVYWHSSQEGRRYAVPHVTKSTLHTMATMTPVPELQRLQSLLNDFVQNTNWGALLAMGDIYYRGAYPRLAPNVTIALDLFHIVALCPNGEMAALGQAKVVELRVQELSSNDVHGTPMPTVFGIQACRVARDILAHTPENMFERPKIQRIQQHHHDLEDEATQMPTRPIHVIDLFAPLFTNDALTNERTTTQQHIAPVLRQERIDSQNVHDHAVSRITSRNIEQLDKSADLGAISKTQVFEDVTNAILSNNDLSADTKHDALRALEALNSHYNTSLGIAEDQALLLVWDRIEKQKDDTVKGNLKESLAKQLASAVEHGHVVCSSGKITRLLATLDGVEDDEIELQTPKPLWALRDELGTLAAKIRDGSSSDNGVATETFAKAARAEYIDKLGMHPQIIEPLITEYSVGF